MIYDHCLPVRLTGNFPRCLSNSSFTILGAGNAVFVRLIRAGSLLIK